jgi:hypothetical protein
MELLNRNYEKKYVFPSYYVNIKVNPDEASIPVTINPEKLIKIDLKRIINEPMPLLFYYCIRRYSFGK